MTESFAAELAHEKGQDEFAETDDRASMEFHHHCMAVVPIGVERGGGVAPALRCPTCPICEGKVGQRKALTFKVVALPALLTQ